MVLNQPNSAREIRERAPASARTAMDRGLHKLTFRAMSTDCCVNFHGVPASTARDFQREVVAWVADFEARYSRFIPDSLIGRINAAAGEHWVDVDPETDRLFSFCNELVFFTRGAFDPTSLPLIKLWNWKATQPTVPDKSAVDAALQLVGWKRIQRQPGKIFLPQTGMSLDLGGIGKEYAVDCVMNMARDRGIQNIMISFGQDVRVLGCPLDKNLWWIGLDDAQQPGKPWAGVAVNNHAVATSGDYLRHFQMEGRRYGHILDPRTGYPVDNGCRAVSVIAPSCTIAGILSTTAFILGPKEGLRLIETHPDAAGSITTDNSRFHTTKFYEIASPQN